MPPSLQYPLVRGRAYSFVSAELGLAGLSMRGYKSFNYKDALKPGLAKGTAPMNLGWTQGDYTAEASIELYRREYDVFIATVINYGRQLGLVNVGFGEIPFPWSITYADMGQPTVTDSLPSVRITSGDSSNSQGADPLTIKVDLEVLEPILWNGKSLVTLMSQGGF